MLDGRVPADAEIHALRGKYYTPTRIKRHEEACAAVTSILGEGLQRAGLRINVPLARAAAHLHDIGKVFQIFPDMRNKIAHVVQPGLEIHHAELGELILRHEGFPEAGKLVRLHIGSMYLRDPEAFDTIESLVVMFSDMRVLDSKICSLNERMEYIQERYGLAWGEGRKMMKKMELDLCGAAGLAPGELKEAVEKRGLDRLGPGG